MFQEPGSCVHAACRTKRGRRGSRRRAFTLVELVVCLCLAAMLVLLIWPAHRRVSDTSRLVDCQANLKLLGVAHHMYANVQKEFFPPHRREGTKMPWYLNAMLRSMMHIGGDYTGVRWPERLLCPERPKDKPAAINRSYGQNGTNVPITNEPEGEAQYIRRGDIKTPDVKIAMADGNDWRVSMTGAEYAKKWDVTREATGAPSEGGTFQVVAYRHSETANAIHFDGSVRNYQKAELWIKNDGKYDLVATRKKWWVSGDETVLPPPKAPPAGSPKTQPGEKPAGTPGAGGKS